MQARIVVGGGSRAAKVVGPPAMLLTAQEFLRENPGESDDRAIREAISGVICRCTGYQQIVEAIQSMATRP